MIALRDVGYGEGANEFWTSASFDYKDKDIAHAPVKQTPQRDYEEEAATPFPQIGTNVNVTI